MATPLTSKLPLPPLPLPCTPNINKPTTTITRQTRPPTTDTQRWHHLTTRTPPTHPFIYAVLTTKIYCLPTCPSRLARRANIIFFSNPTEASKGGFRACKRCKPDVSPSFTSRKASAVVSTSSSSGECEGDVEGKSTSTDPAVMQASSTSSPDNLNFNLNPTAQSTLPSHDTMNYDPTDPTLPLHKSLNIIHQHASRGEKISLADLAEKVGLSKWHLQRAFKRKIGLSPREVGEGLLRERERRGREEEEVVVVVKEREEEEMEGKEETEGEDVGAGIGMGMGMGIGYDTPLALPFPFATQICQAGDILSSDLDATEPDLSTNMAIHSPPPISTSTSTRTEWVDLMNIMPTGNLSPFDPPLLITSDLTESLSSHATTPTHTATPATSSGSVMFSPLNAGLSYSDMIDFDGADSSIHLDGFGPEVENELYDLFREIYEKSNGDDEKQSFMSM